MDEITEVWVFVPDTDRRYAISNYGHLMMNGKKVAGWKKVTTVLDGTIKKPICSFRDSRIGWLVMLDKKPRFFARDDLMALFNLIPTKVDTSLDEELKARRDAGYAEWLKKKESGKTGDAEAAE